MTQPPTPDIAIISNSPAPYRMHVLGRIRDELPQVRLHSIFTHNIDRAGLVDWHFDVDESLRPVFFEKYSLRKRSKASPVCVLLYREIRDYLIEHNIRMVFLHGYNDLTRFLLIRWARHAGVPLLPTSDSNVFAEGRVPPLRRLVKRFYIRWLIRSVAGLTVSGTCGRAYYRIYLDHDKPTFVYPFEPDYEALSSCDEGARRQFMQRGGLDPGRRRLLYCGRLSSVKRVDMLIDAFAQVADQRPKWDLVIAGDGDQRQTLEQRVPAGLRDRVRWLGFLQFDDIAICYHCCDVLVLPSDFEPWALVVNEAMAAGLAVIATEVVGAATDLVRQNINGMIVPPRNMRQLTEAIRQVTDEPRCDRMRAAAGDSLKDWRAAADPVQGVADAMRYFGLIPPATFETKDR